MDPWNFAHWCTVVFASVGEDLAEKLLILLPVLHLLTRAPFTFNCTFTCIEGFRKFTLRERVHLKGIG